MDADAALGRIISPLWGLASYGSATQGFALGFYIAHLMVNSSRLA